MALDEALGTTGVFLAAGEFLAHDQEQHGELFRWLGLVIRGSG